MTRKQYGPGERSGTSRKYAERVAKGQPNMTFSMPKEIADRLRKYAEDNKVSMSSIVAKLVDDWLRRHGG